MLNFNNSMLSTHIIKEVQSIDDRSPEKSRTLLILIIKTHFPFMKVIYDTVSKEGREKLLLIVSLQIEYSMILMNEVSSLSIRQTTTRNCYTNVVSMHISTRQEFIFLTYIFPIFLIENRLRLAHLINQSIELIICQ